MPSLQSLRRKIAAFKNTQKITKAMKMVAAAKLKRSQDRILAARPYALKMRGVVSNLSRRVNRSSHPLLQKREGKKVEVLVVTSDRGLCGGFNGNIVRKSAEFVRQCEAQGLTGNLSIVGRKGRDYFRRRTWPIRQEWTGIFDKLTFEHAIDIGGDLTDHFVKGTFDELYIVYNEFKSAIQQRVIVEKLFPIDAAAEFGTAQAEGTTGGSYLYEPDEAELLNVFIPETFPDADVSHIAGIGRGGTWRQNGGDGRRDAKRRTTHQESDFALQQDPAGRHYQRTDGHRRRRRGAEVD